MAIASLTITLDLAIVRDVCDEVWSLHEKLLKRHGSEFRKLERRIEDLAEGLTLEDFTTATLDGVVVCGAGPRLSGILRDARRLGVI